MATIYSNTTEVTLIAPGIHHRLKSAYEAHVGYIGIEVLFFLEDDMVELLKFADEFDHISIQLDSGQIIKSKVKLIDFDLHFKVDGIVRARLKFLKKD